MGSFQDRQGTRSLLSVHLSELDCMRPIIGLALSLIACQPVLAGGYGVPCPPPQPLMEPGPCGYNHGCYPSQPAARYVPSAPPPVYLAPCETVYGCMGSEQVPQVPAYAAPCGAASGCGDMTTYLPPAPAYPACGPRVMCEGYEASDVSPAPRPYPVAPAYAVPVPVAIAAPAPGLTLESDFFQGDSSVGPMPAGGGYSGGGYVYAPYSASDMPSAGARMAAYGSYLGSASSTVRSSVTFGRGTGFGWGGGVGHPHAGMPGKGGSCCYGPSPTKGSMHGHQGGHGGSYGAKGGHY